MDWFYFENRMRRMTYNLIKPVANQQKKQRGKIGFLIDRLDTSNMKIHALDGEIGKFKHDLRFMEKIMTDISELERKLRTVEDKVEAKHNESSKKFSTLADKLKSSDAQVRALDNDVAVMTTEAKSVHKLVIEAREAQNVIFLRAV